MEGQPIVAGAAPMSEMPAIAEPLANLRELCEVAEHRRTALLRILDRLEGTTQQPNTEKPLVPTEAFPPGLVGEFARVESRLRSHLIGIEGITTRIAEII